MEKITGKIIEVYADFSIDLEGYNKNPLRATDKAKQYISKDYKGKEAEVAIEDGKITFIKILGDSGNGESKSNDSLTEAITKLGWNLGVSAMTSKLALLSELESQKNSGGRTPLQERIHKMLLKDLDKNFKAMEKIKKEQEGK